MLRLISPLVFLFMTSSVFARTSCQNLSQNIDELHRKINAIEIPQIEFSVNERNCQLVLPTLEAANEVETHLLKLLDHYQDYYFDCGREVEIIYIIEDTKINIMMMQTLTEIAKNLDLQCRNAF
ncbi:MAG: hypothetical protein WCY48_01515 [Candidatus Caldatribacteriota bacterium]